MAPEKILFRYKLEGRDHDHDGSLWIGTFNEGIVHVRQGKTDVFGLSQGLSGEAAMLLFEDREGTIWVATESGLDRFRDFAIATYSVNQGLLSPRVTSVIADKDGNVWLASRKGLNRWQSGQIIPSVLRCNAAVTRTMRSRKIMMAEPTTTIPIPTSVYISHSLNQEVQSRPHVNVYGHCT